jgi:hypothetical protein
MRIALCNEAIAPMLPGGRLEIGWASMRSMP